MFDPILLTATIEIGDKVVTFDQSFSITVKCSKFAGKKQNNAQVTIANISEDLRNKILMESSNFSKNRAKKHITIMAGRASIGMETIFFGDIASPVKISQPPDITLSIESNTLNSSKFKTHSSSKNGSVKLSVLAKEIATELGLGLKLIAKDSTVQGFHHVGSQSELIVKLSEASRKNVFVDDSILIVREHNQPIGAAVLCSSDSGMVGIPELNEHGVIITMLYNYAYRLGGQIQLKSKLNPTLDGNYHIFKIDYDLSSKGQNFLVRLECKRI